MSGAPDPAGDPEDAKIVTLARSARLRAHVPVSGQAQGAAVRDSDGRTYAAATVEHPDPALCTSALQAALVAAYASGARRFEACALVADPPELSDRDVALLVGLAPGITALLAGPDGVLVARRPVAG